MKNESGTLYKRSGNRGTDEIVRSNAQISGDSERVQVLIIASALSQLGAISDGPLYWYLQRYKGTFISFLSLLRSPMPFLPSSTL